MKSAAGQPEILLEPRVPVVGLVLFAHGYGETQNALLRVKQLFPLRQALLSSGFAMAASYAHGNDLGRPPGVEDLWQSPADGIVPPAQAASMVAILRSARVPVQLSLLDGNHGNLSKLPPAQIVRFFQA